MADGYVAPVLSSLQRRLALGRRLPPSLTGRIDLFRPGVRDSWGGPLNGQPVRREIVRDIARAVDFDLILETGTYRGTSTEFFAAVFGVTVETVEAEERFYVYSERRLRPLNEVRVSHGDSRDWLRRMARDHGDAVPFIYLDAHWGEDLPLREECSIIAEAWERVVVMIDDFEVPGDPGYAFDDYGPGKVLTEDYLSTADLDGWTIQYPAAPSSAESGQRRGCCVLSPPALAQTMRDVPSLKVA